MVHLRIWPTLTLVVLAAAAPPARAAEAYQIATISSLLAGGYDGDTTVGEMLSHHRQSPRRSRLHAHHRRGPGLCPGNFRPAHPLPGAGSCLERQLGKNWGAAAFPIAHIDLLSPRNCKDYGLSPFQRYLLTS
jgi:hypothetical protein